MGKTIFFLFFYKRGGFLGVGGGFWGKPPRGKKKKKFIVGIIFLKKEKGFRIFGPPFFPIKNWGKFRPGP
jgi:hypothetical protein